MSEEFNPRDIKGLIAEQLGKKLEEITDNLSWDDLGADSLDRVEIIMEIEDKYGLSIANEDTEKIQTVGQAIEYIRKNYQA